MRSFTRRAAAVIVGSAVASAALAQAPAPTTPPATPPVTPPAGTAPLAPPAGGTPPAPVVPTTPPPSVPITPPAAKPVVRPTGVAATVNGQEIPEVAVSRALRQFPATEHAAARKEILNHLVENALIDQYLNALKVTVEQAEVDKLIGELKAELQKAMKDYAKELEGMMLTEAEFRSEVAAQMKWDKFLKQQGSDQALKAFFDKRPDIFDGSLVRCRHILLPLETDKAAAQQDAGRRQGRGRRGGGQGRGGGHRRRTGQAASQGPAAPRKCSASTPRSTPPARRRRPEATCSSSRGSGRWSSRSPRPRSSSTSST